MSGLESEHYSRVPATEDLGRHRVDGSSAPSDFQTKAFRGQMNLPA